MRPTAEVDVMKFSPSIDGSISARVMRCDAEAGAGTAVARRSPASAYESKSSNRSASQDAVTSR